MTGTLGDLLDALNAPTRAVFSGARNLARGDIGGAIPLLSGLGTGAATLAAGGNPAVAGLVGSLTGGLFNQLGGAIDPDRFDVRSLADVLNPNEPLGSTTAPMPLEIAAQFLAAPGAFGLGSMGAHKLGKLAGKGLGALSEATGLSNVGRGIYNKANSLAELLDSLGAGPPGKMGLRLESSMPTAPSSLYDDLRWETPKLMPSSHQRALQALEAGQPMVPGEGMLPGMLPPMPIEPPVGPPVAKPSLAAWRKPEGTFPPTSSRPVPVQTGEVSIPSFEEMMGGNAAAPAAKAAPQIDALPLLDRMLPWGQVLPDAQVMGKTPAMLGKGGPTSFGDMMGSPMRGLMGAEPTQLAFSPGGSPSSLASRIQPAAAQAMPETLGDMLPMMVSSRNPTMFGGPTMPAAGPNMFSSGKQTSLIPELKPPPPNYVPPPISDDMFRKALSKYGDQASTIIEETVAPLTERQRYWATLESIMNFEDAADNAASMPKYLAEAMRLGVPEDVIAKLSAWGKGVPQISSDPLMQAAFVEAKAPAIKTMLGKGGETQLAPLAEMDPELAARLAKTKAGKLDIKAFDPRAIIDQEKAAERADKVQRLMQNREQKAAIDAAFNKEKAAERAARVERLAEAEAKRLADPLSTVEDVVSDTIDKMMEPRSLARLAKKSAGQDINRMIRDAVTDEVDKWALSVGLSTKERAALAMEIDKRIATTPIDRQVFSDPLMQEAFAEAAAAIKKPKVKR